MPNQERRASKRLDEDVSILECPWSSNKKVTPPLLKKRKLIEFTDVLEDDDFIIEVNCLVLNFQGSDDIQEITQKYVLQQPGISYSSADQ
jgi:hypothetical protein